MDELTAIAFAHAAFEKLHPTPPAEFWKYATSGGVARTPDGDYIIGFVWQRKDSKTGAERFFEVRVNGWNARTELILDTPLDDFRPEDFELYR